MNTTSIWTNMITFQISVAAILAAESAAQQEELAALAGTWDGEKRIISKSVYDYYCSSTFDIIVRISLG